jgi:hypothetical protein
MLEEQSSTAPSDAAAEDTQPLYAFLEERLNDLMCRLYESRRMLLEIQMRVAADGELPGRIAQAITSIRQQERVLAMIQRRVEASSH